MVEPHNTGWAEALNWWAQWVRPAETGAEVQMAT